MSQLTFSHEYSSRRWEEQFLNAIIFACISDILMIHDHAIKVLIKKTDLAFGLVLIYLGAHIVDLIDLIIVMWQP